MSTIKRDINVKLNDKKVFKVNVEQYRSTGEVVQDCRNRESIHKNYDMTKAKDIHKSWHGVDNYDEALELLRVGYQPTVDKLKTALKATVSGEGKRVRFENNVHGFAPIVPLALKGVPNSMVNMTMKPIKCKVIDVYYDMGVNGGIKSDSIIEAGQKLLGAIISLEQQGYRFNLYAMQAYSDCNDSDMLCVKVKDSDKPIDLRRISFPLTHPAFFRVVGFDWQGRSPIAKYRGSGRGRAFTDVISLSDAGKVIKKAFGDNAIYLSCNNIIREDEEHIKEVLVG